MRTNPYGPLSIAQQARVKRMGISVPEVPLPASLAEKAAAKTTPAISANLIDLALDDLEAGDALGFLSRSAFGDEHWLRLLSVNVEPFKARGIYERALLEALIASRTNNLHVPLATLHWLLDQADREKLRAAGEPLPGPGPFTLYRGVAGRGAARRVRGISWTGSLSRARWFATRFPELPLPAIYQTVVELRDVFVYTNQSGRNEEEFIVFLRPTAKIRRLEYL